MRAWRVASHIGKIEVERYKESTFGANALSYRRVGRTGQMLVIYPVSFIAGVTQNVSMRAPEIFVELDGDAHLSGTSSSSRASVAA